MQYQFLNILVFILVGIFFVIVTVALLSRLLRPSVHDPAEPAKRETYECGEPAIGSSWVRFDIRFYTLALIFLVFDVEVTFLYPWALIFKPLREYGDSPLGLFLFAEVLLFIAILLVGFVYCWAKGDLDWVKSVSSQSKAERALAAERSRGEEGASKVEAAAVAE